MNGVILVDKATGVTSHDVVDEIRKLLKMKAVGHAGTLDPLATGLLVCLVGDATKLSSYVMSEDKTYRVGVRFGVQTDSGDVTGNVLKESDATALTKEQVSKLVGELTGVLSLPVPKYSAVKVKGRKLYEYARKQEDVEVPTKDMTVRGAALVSFADGRAVIDLECEKGTYVRSWVERLGELLGCGATVESLRRLRSGPFSVDQSHTVAEMEQNPGNVSLIPMVDVLGAWPALKVFGRDLALVRNGQIPNGIYSQLMHFQWENGIRLLYEDGNLLALVVKDPAKGVKLARVFVS